MKMGYIEIQKTNRYEMSYSRTLCFVTTGSVSSLDLRTWATCTDKRRIEKKSLGFSERNILVLIFEVLLWDPPSLVMDGEFLDRDELTHYNSY